jgi:hypothetical protein
MVLDRAWRDERGPIRRIRSGSAHSLGRVVALSDKWFSPAFQVL